MFIMMNAARFGVGLEGVAACERSYQRARDYARDRIQCTDIGVRGGPKVAIIAHPDVRRMLMTMRAHAEATRALAYVVAAAHDTAIHHPDAAERKRNQAFVDLMIGGGQGLEHRERGEHGLDGRAGAWRHGLHRRNRRRAAPARRADLDDLRRAPRPFRPTT
jgi:alkylation response protein AidB-like acyl-CoA dehydrogenase